MMYQDSLNIVNPDALNTMALMHLDDPGSVSHILTRPDGSQLSPVTGMGTWYVRKLFFNKELFRHKKPDVKHILTFSTGVVARASTLQPTLLLSLAKLAPSSYQITTRLWTTRCRKSCGNSRKSTKVICVTDSERVLA